MTHSFTLKLERAREHLQSFKREAGAWIESKPYTIVDEPNPEGHSHPLDPFVPVRRRFRVTRVDPVPGRLSLIVGDCLFNIRSALDHLALSLAKSFTPKMTDEQIAGSEFPIFGGATLDQKTEMKKIGCIDPGARTIIKALQPYQRGHGYKSHPLWQVHELNRIDKHRALTICATRPEEYFGFKVVRVREGIHPLCFSYVITSPRGALKVDDVLLRYATPIGYPYDENDAEPCVPIEIAFGEGGPAPLEPVVPSLEAICDFVRDCVIATLSKFL